MDHSVLSPSGRVSKRAEKAAKERVRRELFGDGLAFPSCQQPSKRESLLRQSQDLRELAARGLKPRAHIKLAAALENEANEE